MDLAKGSRLSFLPIPTLIALIGITYFTVNPSLYFEPPWLLPVTNALFVSAVCLVVAHIAMKNYRATGRIQILLLGCGVLVFGVGGALAGFLRSVPGIGADLNVTIYNVGALLGGAFHFAAALILLTGVSPEAGSKRKDLWLALGYGGLLVLMGLLSFADTKGMIPPFFIQGEGPSALRQKVLGSADLLFVFSWIVFAGTYLRNREVFLYWYSSALALTAISLTAFLVESAVGSVVGWEGRIAQYLGGIYFLIAIITAIRSAQMRRTTFENVLTASLTPAEERFRALAENTPDVIRRFDREMKHIYVNPAGLRLYGKPARSIIGRTIEQVGLEESGCSIWKERLRTVLETGEIMEVEDCLPAAEETRFYVSHCVPEYGPEGTVANVLVVSRDATAHKRAEADLKSLNETLEQRVAQRTAEAAQRAEQLGRLAAELTLAEQRERQRLAQILHDGLQQLLVGAKLRLALADKSGDAHGASAEVDELIDSAIEISRSLSAELSPPILRHGGLVPALEWLGRWMLDKYGLRVDLTAPREIGKVPEETITLLFQAARELLFNVVKHAGVKAARLDVQRCEGHVQMTVEDDGVGFDPGWAMAGGGGAGGIGLFSLRERFAFMGGRMEIDSMPGRGSRFRLLVPQAMAANDSERRPRKERARVSRRASAQSQAESGTKKAIRLLLVDDHVVTRQGLAALLRAEPDFRVVGEASDGISAINLVLEQRPDVVLMDVNLPGMNGVEATRIIREKLPAASIIGLSMLDDSVQAAAMRAAGAAHYLTKSGPCEAVIAAIRDCARTAAVGESPKQATE